MVGHRDGELEAGVGCRGAVDKSGTTLAQVSIPCLAPVPGKKGDPSGSLGQGGGWGCGAKEFSRRWEEEGAEDWVVAIAMLGSFSVSHLMCGAAGGTGADLELAKQLQERSGRAEAAWASLSGILCSSSQDRTLVPCPQPQVPFTVTEQLKAAPPTTWAFCSITGHSLLQNKAQSQCICPAA